MMSKTTTGVTIEVKSEGKREKVNFTHGSASIKVNGKEILKTVKGDGVEEDGVKGDGTTKTRGLYVAVINEQDGSVLQKKHFKTYDTFEEANNFAKFIQEIPVGRLVAIAVCDEGSKYITGTASCGGGRNQEAIDACKSLGSTKIEQLKWRDSWALISFKGDLENKANKAVEVVSQNSACQLKRTLVVIEAKSRGKYEPQGWYKANSTDGYAVITKHGKEVLNISGETNRGINLAVFNENDGHLIDLKRFDTWFSRKAAEDFAKYVNSLPNGRIVALVVCDEGSKYLQKSQAAIDACKSLGSKKIENLEFRYSWALIGQKGSEKNIQIQEEINASDEAIVSSSIFVNPDFSHSNYQAISNKSLLVRDYVLNGENIEEVTRYRTIVSLSPEIKEVKVWAEYATEVEIFGEKYTLSADSRKAIKVKPNAIGKIIINIDEVSLSLSKLFLQTEAMAEKAKNEKYVICPDVEVHKKLNNLRSSDFYENKDELFKDDFFYGMNTQQVEQHCKDAHAAISNLANCIQYSYNKLEDDSIHHERKLVPVNMKHSNFQLDFVENNQVNLSHIHKDEADEHLTKAKLITPVTQGFFDFEWVKDAEKIVLSTVSHAVHDVEKGVETAVHTIVNEVEKDIVHPIGETLVHGEVVLEDVSHHIAQSTKNFFNEVGDEVKHVIHVVVKKGEELVKYVIEKVEELGHFIHNLLDKLGLELKKVWEWLKFVTDWDDILKTQEAFIEIFNQGLDYMKNKSEDLNKSINEALKSANKEWDKDIDAIKNRIYPGSVAHQVKDSSKYNSPEAKGEMEWLLSKVVENHSDDSIPQASISSETNTKADKLFGSIQEVLEKNNVENHLKETFKDIGNVVTSDSVEALILKALDVVKDLGDLAFSVMESIVDFLFQLFKAILGEIKWILNVPIYIPFLSDFFKYITKEQNLTLLNLSSFIVAAPATILYKVITGKKTTPPLSDSPFQGAEEFDSGLWYGIIQIINGFMNYALAVFEELYDGTLTEARILMGISFFSAVLAQATGHPFEVEGESKNKQKFIWYYQFLGLAISGFAIYEISKTIKNDPSGSLITLKSAVSRYTVITTSVYEAFHLFLFVYLISKHEKELTKWAMYLLDPLMGLLAIGDEFIKNPCIVIPLDIGRCLVSQCSYGYLSISIGLSRARA
jgi:hypothetical protein